MGKAQGFSPRIAPNWSWHSCSLTAWPSHRILASWGRASFACCFRDFAPPRFVSHASPPPPWGFKICSFALAGSGRQWASTVTGFTTHGTYTQRLGHLLGLHTMGNPPALSAPGALPHGLPLQCLAYRARTSLCLHFNGCNRVNRGHC
jgi:hypothetical protein